MTQASHTRGEINLGETRNSETSRALAYIRQLKATKLTRKNTLTILKVQAMTLIWMSGRISIFCAR